jgi:hypothetical protein
MGKVFMSCKGEFGGTADPSTPVAEATSAQDDKEHL